MITNSIQVLIDKIASGDYSEAELTSFLEVVKAMDKSSFQEAYQLLYERVNQYPSEQLSNAFKEQMERSLDEMERREEFLSGNLVAEKGDESVPMTRRKWWLWAAAAAILFIAAGITDILINQTNEKQPVISPSTITDIAPGGNKAVLTLGNGARITLDSANNGLLTRQGRIIITKKDSGLITYSGTAGSPKEIQYNTLSTPRGGQYQLQLPDGTKVWLNAASSISYPTVFVGNERTVEITGEVYFEVVHNPAQPFEVKVAGQVIRDIGTTFDINAYADEPSLQTTVLEGSVMMNKTILKVGQQAELENDRIIVRKVDVDRTVSWKDGVFSFDNADIYSIMRQISRWYDIEVVYEGKMDVAPFKGEMGRSLTLAQILKVLQSLHVHYRLEKGNRIVIHS